MTAVVLYFQVHQPFRLRRYGFFDIARSDRWFDDGENERITRRVAEKCYLPMNALLLRHVLGTGGGFRCAFSISGTALDQLERWAPEALESFRALARTGHVEILGETSHHSLAFLGDAGEFRAQVRSHRARVRRLFGRAPRTFRNTELVFDNAVARAAEEMGFDALLGEGADHVLGWRSRHAAYRPTGCRRLRALLRSYRLSDDIAFRFSDRGWAEWPLSAAKFAGWLHRVPRKAPYVGLFMDYETAGEHQWAEGGIFEFMERLPGAVLEDPRFTFRTPAEAAAAAPAPAPLDVPHPVSWADAERDLSAWLGNGMQREAHRALYALLPAARRAARAGRLDLLEAWRRLSTSDHFYYMSTKFWSDGDVHRYFNPWLSPHDAYSVYMNVLDDLARRAERAAGAPRRPAKVAPA